MRRLGITLLAALCVSAVWPADSGSAERGRRIYEHRCTGCHSLDETRVGPALRGVFGRRAATDPKFPYSEALKKSRLVWDEPTLDRWLADPEAAAPDNDMAFRLDRAEERSAIIEYLRQLSAKGRH